MENTKMELELKGIEAAKKYLVSRHGMEILNEEPFECEAGKMAIVARDDERGIVFVDVIVKDGDECGSAERGGSRRSRLERIAVAFLAGYDETNAPVCFDEMTVTVVNDSRALLRHHLNIMGALD